jgi:hypothetical protein
VKKTIPSLRNNRTPLKPIDKQEWETGNAALTQYPQNRKSKKYKATATKFLKLCLKGCEKQSR